MNMEKVSQTIEAKVREIFSLEDAAVALAALSAMEIPLSNSEWSTTRDRVQAAILVLSNSRIDRLLKEVSASQVDWRDTLMGAGLAGSDWPLIAKKLGFEIA
ncbi:hypothetical protein [Variovorax sp. GB1P17]|uniref:hypothetical protein n=1 Tax=Variovorax sp. GB1P17 TaxID=3443740 RepID=UPI003F45B3CB